MPSSDLLQQARFGARKILTECLGLQKGDVLAIFFDETTLEPATLIRGEAAALGIIVRERKTTLDYQASFSKPGAAKELSLEDLETISAARSVVTCLSSRPDSHTYRRELVRAGPDRDRRLGHMPGVDLVLLATAINIDYREASVKCNDLALALCIGKSATLTSYICDGNGAPRESHQLVCNLGGIHRPSISSNGVIPLDTWGNLPGGETFIAPIEHSTNGTFILNGSFKDYVLEPPSYLLLKFSEGQLTSVNGDRAALTRFEQLFLRAQENSDEGYLTLAELGIGVNTRITQLTGNSLLDEKCARTAHIALGDNTSYGGRSESRVHEDLITRNPSLSIDGKQVLKKGEFAFLSEDWREDLHSTTPDRESLTSEGFIGRTNIAAETGKGGVLNVRRTVAAGRLCLYTVAEFETSRTLSKIYSLIPIFPQKIRKRNLLGQAEQDLSLPRHKTMVAIEILLRHGLIDFKKRLGTT